VAEAHRIVVVDKGEIVEDGSHADLLKTGGRYAKLWAAQTGTPGQREEPSGDRRGVRMA
jgi:ABC-type multidrug transport system fused ATPase/permease subunit